MTSVAAITGDASRVAALYALWRRDGRAVWLTLRGGSMLPAIPPGSRICLDFSPREFAVGEIVGALHGSRLVIHRLVRIETGAAQEPQYICRGDANPLADPPVARAQIVGVVREWRAPSRLLRLQQAVVGRLRSRTAGLRHWPKR